MDRYIGKLLDNRYEILECIGTGGMAVVYKARCHRLNRLVAVKILKPELAQDAEFRRRFHDESQAVAMLSHPNIVAVYDVSSSDDLDYIVMELIDGITLKQYMHKKGLPLNWREALHFITQIMKALSHAHDRGIIHRDIKPQNIMVLRDGSVKVADFGIARLASAAQATLTQEALGSVHYISPEQARGSYIDTRAEHRDRMSLRGKRRARDHAVNAGRHSAYGNHTGRRKLVRYFIRGTASVFAHLTRSDDTDAKKLIKIRYIPATVKHCRRRGDRAQTCGISFVRISDYIYPESLTAFTDIHSSVKILIGERIFKRSCVTVLTDYRFNIRAIYLERGFKTVDKIPQMRAARSKSLR